MIDLYMAATPNGLKISIMLEECGADYQVIPIDLSKLEQKQDWFLAMNPNGRIPVIKDTDNNDFIVFESGAILVYLAEKYQKFMPENQRYEILQWLMFQMGGVGPMQGQAHVFVNYAPEKIPYAIERYQKETRRLYEVYDKRLADREYICGDISIADFATAPWVASHEWAGLNIDDLPHLSRWLELFKSRPGVQRGLKAIEEKSKTDRTEAGKNMLT